MNIPVDTDLRGSWVPDPVDFGGLADTGTSLVTAQLFPLGGNAPLTILSVTFVGGAPAAGVSITQTTTVFTGDTIAITTLSTPAASYMGTIRAVVQDNVGFTIQVDVDYDVEVVGAFDALLIPFAMVFEYSYATDAGEDVPNTGSAGSAHDFEPGGTDPLRGIVGGDVAGSIASTLGVDANNQVFAHPGTMTSDFADWDALAATGSIVVVFRTTQARAFDNILVGARSSPSGFFKWQLHTVGDPNGKLELDVIRSSNSQDSRIQSGNVLFINDGRYVVAVIAQPGGGGGMEMYVDGVDVGVPSGAEPNNWFPSVAQSWNQLHVGALAGVTSPFKGDLDYWGVTETVLTLDDAADLFFAYNGLVNGTALQDLLDALEGGGGPRIQYNLTETGSPVINFGSATGNDLSIINDGGVFDGVFLRPGVPIDREGPHGAIDQCTVGGLRNASTTNWSSGGATNAGTWIWIIDLTGAASSDWLGGCTFNVDDDGVQVRIFTGGSNSALTLEYRVQDSGSGDSTRLYDPVGLNNFGAGTGFHVWTFRQDGIGTEFPDLFIDGVLIDPSDLTDFTGTCPIDFWFGSFTKSEGNLFRRGGVTGNPKFGGIMDMMIYTNDVLTDQQILDISDAALLFA